MNMMWPQFPADFGGVMSRRLAELYDIANADENEAGLIEGLLLPLEGMIIYPQMLTPLLVEDSGMAKAVESATSKGATMIAIAMRSPDGDFMDPDNLHAVGTEVAVGKMVYTSDGIMTVLAQGRRRVEIVEFVPEGDWYRVRARPVYDNIDDSSTGNRSTHAGRALLIRRMRSTQSQSSGRGICLRAEHRISGLAC